MESIKVTTEDLRATATNIAAKAENYYRIYEALLRDVDEFTRTDWQGDDADAFKMKVLDFRDDFDKMRNLMDQYEDVLRRLADNYDKVPEELKRKVQAL